MLKSSCINPEIMKVLSLCGHGDKILIADGNYPLEGKTDKAYRVYLGLTAGVPTATQVLETLLHEINVEKAEVMLPENGRRPEILKEFENLLNGMEFSNLGRFEFYDARRAPDVKLAISTGEKRTYANVLLTVGVV